MKYVALLTNTEEQVQGWEEMSPEEAQAAREREIPKWNALFEELMSGGHYLDGAELESPTEAKTVRVRDGETLITDGPYAETKEQVGGFFLLECKDLDEAIAIAAKIPVVSRASVELRPIIEH